MRDDTKQNKKKKGAWICALVVIGAALAYLAFALIPLVSESFGDGFLIAFLILYGLIFLAIIAGVLIALYQRLKEIEGGEEEDAKKY